MKTFEYNIFFKINNYFIYILNPHDEIKYNFLCAKNNYYLQLIKKNKKHIPITFKIFNHEHKCYYYHINKTNKDFFKLNSFYLLDFKSIHNDDIIIHDIDILKKKCNHLNIELYNQNLFDLTLTDENIHFLYLNWYYFGQFNNYQYWKYILYKNKNLFNDIYQKNINYTLNYSKENKFSLVFIDDRFDPIFEYILIMFLIGVHDKWNLTLFTLPKYFESYKNICNKLNIDCVCNEIQKINNVHEYSYMLKSYDFWNYFNEEYVLIFQYDSCCFKNLPNKFYTMNYIGAQWPDHIQQLPNIYNGNGGTSFRKVADMKYITLKYNYFLNDKEIPEDMYFSKYLHLENRLINNPDLCNEFSIENVFYKDSIFGHQIYQSISLDQLENFIIKRLNDLLK